MQMIDMEYGKFFLACDICGEEKQGFESFDDAVDYQKDNEWKADKGETLELEYGIIDICPDCQERGK